MKNINIIPYSILILFLVVVVVGLFLSRNNRNRSSKYFAVLVFLTMCYLISSLVSEIIDGNPNLRVLIYITNLLGFLEIDFIVITFLCYLLNLMGKRNKTTKPLFVIIMVSESISVICSIVLASIGLLFKVNSDGYYVETYYTYVPYVVAAFILIELIFFMLFNRKAFTRRQFIVMTIYIFLPIIGVVSEMILNTIYENVDIYFISGLTMTISVLMIYVLIQDTTIIDENAKSKMLEDISKTDFLTGMKNRRSYYEKIKSLAPNSLVGVIFSDLNGLKYKNDHYGHTAGDLLITDYSKMIISSFGFENSFRISGDEFVVIISNVTEKEFIKKYEAFYGLVEANNHIGAVGKSFGSGDCIEKLISEAENEMYDDKTIYGIKRQ